MKQILNAQELSREFGLPLARLNDLVAANVIPQPIRLKPGQKTSKRLWLRSAVAQALGVPLTPPN